MVTRGTEVEKRDEELYGLALPTVEGTGFELVGVDDVVEHGRRVFRFYIDHPRGVAVSDCASVSREIEYLLDARLDFEGSYVLEVSSPGLEHPLKHEREYEHFRGRRARIVLHRPVEAGNVVEGVLGPIGDDGVVVTTDRGEEIRLDFENIARAKLAS
ncbi:MAG: ribosome maturation factor RimP [Candidatus Eisenbacteria bacterium]|nr:ribosome maturation factor RimP [Candidatus Eisenbacteria bacterium]